MEQLLFFVLGVGTVLVIAGVVVAFRTYFKVESLEDSVENTQREFDNVYRKIDEEVNQLHIRVDTDIKHIIDDEIRGITERINDVERSTENNFQHLDGRIDSRVDKLESRTQEELRDVHRRIDDVDRHIEDFIEDDEIDESNFVDPSDDSNKLN